MTAPDFPPEVIEKAARMAHCPWCVAEPTEPCQEWAEPVKHLHPDRLSAARAVLAAVADDLRAEGVTQKHGPCICNTGPGTDGPDEFCPHHGRTYAEVLAGWEQDYALAKSGFDAEATAAREAEAEADTAYQRGMVDGQKVLSIYCERDHEDEHDITCLLTAGLADAERRGAVAALREAADNLNNPHGATTPIVAWLRARADRIEGDGRG